MSTLSKEQMDAMLQKPDPYSGLKPIPPGVGPGTGEFVETPKYERPLERNVCVGPMIVSTCRCPQCGEIYVRGEVYRGGYSQCMDKDEPDPPCWRCEVSVGVPLDPDEAAAMVEFRWRYDAYLAAIDIGSRKSKADMKHLFVTACDAGMNYAPMLLRALERRYGNQVDAGVQAILNGASGVR